ncbi:TPA: DNA processing protein DprA, partial [Streptococcus pneumoniae]|nr:DNA processing protein DprA [Streptococcus pneumoniae]
MKITNYEIYKLKKSGLTNQQILKVLEYGENVDQELLLGDIADISGCRNPAVFMERYFQIDDAHLSKEFQKFPSFSILDDCYPWDLS